jgi:hypothetical protein
MKKTAQTLLTAAMFVSALGGSAAGKDSMKCNATADTPATTTTTTGLEAFMTTGPVLYGPPWVFGTTTTTTETVTTDDSAQTVTEPSVTDIDPDFTTTTFMPMTTPEILYGPPSVFMDMNRDGSLDSRDLTLMKRKALGKLDDGSYIGDVNHSGKVDKYDVEQFLHEGLGMPYKPVVTTAPPVETGTTTRTTVTDENGDVIIETTTAKPVTELTEQTTLPPTTPTTVVTTKRTEVTVQTAETLQRVTETAVMPLYGPPPAFDK